VFNPQKPEVLPAKFSFSGSFKVKSVAKEVNNKRIATIAAIYSTVGELNGPSLGHL